jgi:hypothetical protein
VQLNWIPHKERKGEIAFLAHDSCYEEHTPDFFDTEFGHYALTHFLPFDITLARRLQPYYEESR